MEQMKAGYNWKYGGLWVLANILGWGVSVSSVFALTSIIGGRNGELWSIPAALLIGLAQWLVLAPRFSLSGWLIPAYGLGWFIGLWLGMNLDVQAPGLLMGALGGALVGVIQWLSIRSRLCRSFIWVPTMTVSSSLGCGIGVWTGPALSDTSTSLGVNFASAIGGAVAGAVIGVLSGFILVILTKSERGLRQSSWSSTTS
jgi:hypothetical protein